MKRQKYFFWHNDLSQICPKAHKMGSSRGWGWASMENGSNLAPCKPISSSTFAQYFYPCRRDLESELTTCTADYQEACSKISRKPRGSDKRTYTEGWTMFPTEKIVQRPPWGTIKVWVRVSFPEDLFFITKYFILNSYPSKIVHITKQ